MKLTIFSIIIASALIIGAVFLANNKPGDNAAVNSSIIDGAQIVEITAKGGYSPAITVAKADIPVILKVRTQGTFDCSLALRIPSIGYKTNLTPTGVTEIKIPPQKAGTTLQGLCSMGMYGFQIKFE